MTDSFERKPSSSDLLSRLKTRKVLGVGQTFGPTTGSKVTQILGQKTEHCEELPILSCVLYWNYFIAASLLFTGTMVLFCGDICGNLLIGFWIWDRESDAEMKGHYRETFDKERRVLTMHLGVAMFCVGSIMCYSLMVIRSGGTRIAQFSSTLYFILIWIVLPIRTGDHEGPSHVAFGIMLINTMCHLHVIFPRWTFWTRMRRKLALIGDKCSVNLIRSNPNPSVSSFSNLRGGMQTHSAVEGNSNATIQASSANEAKQHSD